MFRLTKLRFLRNKVGTAPLDFSALGFEYLPTAGHCIATFKKGQGWGPIQFSPDPYMKVHVLGNVFHYGQSVFEGTKAFHLKDKSVAVFSDDLNHERLNLSCRRLQIPEIPWDLWKEAVDQTIKENAAYIPPYGSNGSLYLRPVVFGSGPKMGVGASDEYKFAVVANPVGSYYKSGEIKPLDALIPEFFDRCAPYGIGDAKASANYAADLTSMAEAKKLGFPICLYLDPKERKYVTEFNTSNFIAIQGNTYLTPPNSRLVLNSVTNRRLSEIAEHLMGMKVVRKQLDFVKEVSSWDEVGAVGTAVVVTPIKSITHGNTKHQIINKQGSISKLKEMHDLVRSIQTGDKPDHFKWLRPIF
jgi:branched-chain amino acid aminotransferase